MEQLAAENDELEAMIGAIETKGLPIVASQQASGPAPAPGLGPAPAGYTHQPLSSSVLPSAPPTLARSGSSNSSVTVY